MMSNLPCTMDAEFLVSLLHKAEVTVLRDVTRDKKHERQVYKELLAGGSK